jgi:hypothetical protein
VVAHRPAFTIELLDRVLQPGEGVGVVEDALHETEPLLELTPDVLIEGRPRVLLDGFVDDLLEVLTLPLATGEAHEREPRREQAAIGQVVHGRHQLLARQVACHAEDDQAARPGDAIESSIGGQPQRVGLRGDLDR